MTLGRRDCWRISVFEALATTSAGFAFSLGQKDYTLSREQVPAHAAEIVSATDPPVSADLEGGFGDACSEFQLRRMSFTNVGRPRPFASTRVVRRVWN